MAKDPTAQPFINHPLADFWTVRFLNILVVDRPEHLLPQQSQKQELEEWAHRLLSLASLTRVAMVTRV